MYESSGGIAASSYLAAHLPPSRLYTEVSYLFRVVYIYCTIGKKSNRRAFNMRLFCWMDHLTGIGLDPTEI